METFDSSSIASPSPPLVFSRIVLALTVAALRAWISDKVLYTDLGVRAVCEHCPTSAFSCFCQLFVLVFDT